MRHQRGGGYDVAKGPEDELEHALLEVRALIESTVAIHRDRSTRAQQIATVDGGYGPVLHAAATLIRGPCRPSTSCTPGCREPRRCRDAASGPNGN